jgi:hypothetical protein
MTEQKREPKYKVTKNFENLIKGKIVDRSYLMVQLESMTCSENDKWAGIAGEPSMMSRGGPGRIRQDSERILDCYISHLRNLGIIEQVL